jgi:hypothetical protein
VALLAFSFFVTWRYSRHEALRTEEYAYACDPFGYLRMAKQIRNAFARGDRPQFKIESTQTRTLIDFMQQKQMALPRWDEVVAPHAHHYFPRSGYVGVQYPPGTGLALAVFPQGEAVYGLNRVVVSVFALSGLCVLLVAAWKRAWASIALVVLALSLALLVLARMGEASLSINAVLVPIFLTCLLSLIALWLNRSGRDRLAFVCAFLAGVSLGFATLVRLPSFLLLPGFVILLWPGWRGLLRFTSLPLALVLGTALAGVLPVLINQSDVAGAWYLSTYASVDAAPPTLESVKSNVSFFLGNGPGAVDNWALLVAVAGFAGFVMVTRAGGAKGDEGTKDRLGFNWQRVAVAAATLWVISICYFLTHRITAPHYMIPTIFATVALLGIGAFALEVNSRHRLDLRRAISWVALVLILAPGVALLNRAWPVRYKLPGHARAFTHPPILLPAELVDDKAWIWADLLTGPLWYYANKPAFKIQFTDEETRALIFRYVFERGERQYLLQDSEQMKKYMEEIERLGGKLEPRGKVDGQPYFLIAWPNGGPR